MTHALLLLPLALGQDGPAARPDVCGVWDAVAVVWEGGEAVATEQTGLRLAIDQGRALWRVTAPSLGRSFRTHCRIDPAASPKQIDLREPNEFGPGRLLLGIYECDGPRLVIHAGEERPDDFLGDPQVALELVRDEDARIEDEFESAAESMREAQFSLALEDAERSKQAWAKAFAVAGVQFFALSMACYLRLTAKAFARRLYALGGMLALMTALPAVGVPVGLIVGWKHGRRWGIPGWMALWTALLVLGFVNLALGVASAKMPAYEWGYWFGRLSEFAPPGHSAGGNS